jgi:hypothetical protein
MVKQDYEEHRESLGVKSSTLKVMTEALAVSSGSPQLTMACTIAKWALEAKYEDLYQQAVSIALSGKVPSKELVDVVSRHLDEAFAENPNEVDWQKWCVCGFSGQVPEDVLVLGGSVMLGLV